MTKCVLPDYVIKQYVLENNRYGVKQVERLPTATIPKLVIVGGGVSAKHELDVLKSWTGHIWAINQGAQWLASEGVTTGVSMFSISPTERPVEYVKGVSSAILGSCCSPRLFAALKDEGADVEIFNVVPWFAPSSVGNIFGPAVLKGYTDITFFGCEGSFEKDVYFYRNEVRRDQMVVRAGGKDFITTPDIFVTTQHLVGVLKANSDIKERSGGLLRAMINHEWQVVALSESMKDSPDAKPYVPNKEPLRFNFNTLGLVTGEVFNAQAMVNIEAGWPILEKRDPHLTPLAVVGSGPSMIEHLDELKEWTGDIWAINQSAAWLQMQGIDCYLFTVDPDEAMAELQFVNGVERAILGSGCHPKLFEALHGKDLRMFHCRNIPGKELTVLGGGPCSAARASMQAAWQGYPGITYFGCEGSFRDTTHAFRNESRPNQMIVRAGGKDYRTTPDLYINTMYLAGEIREYPKALKEKSGGLLRAMLEYPDTWEVVALSEKMRDRLDPTAMDKYRVAA